MSKISTDRTFEAKWSELIARFGYTAIPNLAIEHQKELNISSTEMNILVALCKFRWEKSNPWPSASTLAQYSGNSISTVRRIIRSLEGKGIIERIYHTGSSSEYNLDGLIKKLETVAENLLESTQKKLDSTVSVASLPYSKLDTKEYPVEENSVKNARKRLGAGYAKFLFIGKRLKGNRQKTEDK